MPWASVNQRPLPDGHPSRPQIDLQNSILSTIFAERVMCGLPSGKRYIGMNVLKWERPISRYSPPSFHVCHRPESGEGFLKSHHILLCVEKILPMFGKVGPHLDEQPADLPVPGVGQDGGKEKERQLVPVANTFHMKSSSLWCIFWPPYCSG